MKKLILIAFLFVGCAGSQQFFSTPQGQAVLVNSQSLANVALNAVLAKNGGPMTNVLASTGLAALGSVLQAYVNQPIPTSVVQATPGVAGVGAAMVPLVSSTKPVTQNDVNTVFNAATIAAKK